MSGLLLLILIFIGMPLLWRWLKPFFFRWAQHRTEDYLRQQMGMPPRDGARPKSGFHHESRNGFRSSSSRGDSGNRGRKASASQRPLIPKEYAVDVEYTEIRSFSADETIASDGHTVRYSVESQVSDAEIIEISRDR